MARAHWSQRGHDGARHCLTHSAAIGNFSSFVGAVGVDGGGLEALGCCGRREAASLDLSRRGSDWPGSRLGMPQKIAKTADPARGSNPGPLREFRSIGTQSSSTELAGHVHTRAKDTFSLHSSILDNHLTFAQMTRVPVDVFFTRTTVWLYVKHV